MDEKKIPVRYPDKYCNEVMTSKNPYTVAEKDYTSFKRTLARFGRTALIAAHSVLKKYRTAKQRKISAAGHSTIIIQNETGDHSFADPVDVVLSGIVSDSQKEEMFRKMDKTHPKDEMVILDTSNTELEVSYSTQKIINRLGLKKEHRELRDIFVEMRAAQKRVNQSLIRNGMEDLVDDISDEDCDFEEKDLPTRSFMNCFESELLIDALSLESVTTKSRHDRQNSDQLLNLQGNMLEIIEDYLQTCDVRLHAMEDLGDWLFTMEDVEHYIGPLECEIETQGHNLEEWQKKFWSHIKESKVLHRKAYKEGQKLLAMCKTKSEKLKKHPS